MVRLVVATCTARVMQHALQSWQARDATTGHQMRSGVHFLDPKVERFVHALMVDSVSEAVKTYCHHTRDVNAYDQFMTAASKPAPLAAIRSVAAASSAAAVDAWVRSLSQAAELRNSAQTNGHNGHAGPLTANGNARLLNGLRQPPEAVLHERRLDDSWVLTLNHLCLQPGFQQFCFGAAHAAASGAVESVVTYVTGPQQPSEIDSDGLRLHQPPSLSCVVTFNDLCSQPSVRQLCFDLCYAAGSGAVTTFVACFSSFVASHTISQVTCTCFWTAIAYCLTMLTSLCASLTGILTLRFLTLLPWIVLHVMWPVMRFSSNM
jgi:hypothetical protein